MKKIIIAALAENNVIGKDGKMPWHIKEELKHFKNTTMSYPLIMGRKTFESFGGKPLKGRLNIIVTRNKNYKPDFENVTVVHSLNSAYTTCEMMQHEKVFVIGGAQIYNSAIEVADEMVLTNVKMKVEGDTYFPEVDENIWKVSEIKSFDEFDVLYYTRI